jgi:hypothetical protein
MAKSEDKTAVHTTEEEAAGATYLSPNDPQLDPNVAVDSPVVTGVDPEAEAVAEREAEEAAKAQESIDAAIAAGVNPINIPPEGLDEQGSEPIEDIPSDEEKAAAKDEKKAEKAE